MSYFLTYRKPYSIVRGCIFVCFMCHWQKHLIDGPDVFDLNIFSSFKVKEDHRNFFAGAGADHGTPPPDWFHYSNRAFTTVYCWVFFLSHCRLSERAVEWRLN